VTRRAGPLLHEAAIVGIALASLSLRPLFASFAAVLPQVQRDLDLSPATLSVLSMLPVTCLGLFSFPASALIRRVGPERTLSISLLTIAAGSALRGIPAFGSVALGTVLAGAGIAIGNVALPAIVKKRFVDGVGSVTALYTSLLCAGAALAALMTPIIERHTGSWSLALIVWAVPAVVALAVWTPTSRRSYASPDSMEGISVLKQAIVWQLTAFMGLQSALAYSIFGWLASILETRGLTSIEAGQVVACSILTQVVSCACIPPLAVRCRSQSLLAILLSILATAGLIGLITFPISVLMAIGMLQGFGQGGLIALAMTMIALRSADAEISGRVSGVVQGGGYLLAAGCSFVTGVLVSGASANLLCYWIATVGAATLVAGAVAGRNILIGRC
jgi:MFS transporter, CP family, cyanate transporter